MRAKPTREEFNRQLEHLIRTLRQEITEEKEPGDYLPSEMVLAVRFGMSNNSIRKGLDRLVEEELMRGNGSLQYHFKRYTHDLSVK